MQEQSSKDHRADRGEKNSLSKEKGLSVKDKGNRLGQRNLLPGQQEDVAGKHEGRRRRELAAEINVSARA